MRNWVLITLMAFMGTVLSSGSHCIESLDVHTSSAQVTAMQTDAVQASHSDTSSSVPTPVHQDCFCNHVHCCGIILSYHKVTFDVSLVDSHSPSKSSLLLSVDLELPIKPPAA
jgi:hypothetical protein